VDIRYDQSLRFIIREVKQISRDHNP